MWEELYNSLRIVLRRRSAVHPVPCDESLDEFERRFGFALPRSYREFIKVFGAGVLGGNFRITAPGYPSLRSQWSPNILDLNALWHDDDERHTHLSGKELSFLQAMWYFCETTEGEVIGWNRGEVSDPKHKEYVIYLRMRSDRFVRLANTFTEFILHICLGSDFDARLQEHGLVVESPSQFSHTFVPVQTARRPT